LPTHLIASFHSTLAEAADSDVLIHVADCSHPALDRHIEAVTETLTQLGMENKPQLLVLNKVDNLPDRHSLEHLRERYPSALVVSAVSGYNIHRLLCMMEQYVLDNSTRVRLRIPFTAIKSLSSFYANAIVEQRQDTDHGILLDLRIPPSRQKVIASLIEIFSNDVEQLSTP
jgi:GTP-binding protein HflX